MLEKTTLVDQETKNRYEAISERIEQESPEQEDDDPDTTLASDLHPNTR